MTDDAGSKPEPAPIRGPFAKRSPAARRRILMIAGLAALALWIFLIVQDAEIKRSNGPGIVPFEVAGTTEEADDILDEWGPAGRDAARVSLHVDFAYLVAYALFLAVGCTIAAQRLARRGMTRLARIGPLLGWLQFAAAGFDAIENAALLRVVAGHTETWPGVALYAAIGKFTIAGLGLAYVILAAVVGLLRGAGAVAGDSVEGRPAG